MEKTIAEVKKEIELQVADISTLETLLQTTFKGLSAESAKKAMLEAMLRGMTFQDFLQKNVYAIPYGSNYSLVNSIDYCRKIGMRSGVCGKSAPEFEEKDGKIISCTVTIKRKVSDYIGEYSAKVYFDEYNTGRNQWVSKPRTMIAKVAEMHALRMACPEELSQAYLEEEYQQDTEKVLLTEEAQTKKMEEYKVSLENCKDLVELQTVWSNLPAKAKGEFNLLKEELKKKYASV